MPARVAPALYQVRITLLGIRPPIWRRVQVPATVRLSRFHRVIQTVMGWTDSHLHRFVKNGQDYGMILDDLDEEVINDRYVRLNRLLAAEGESVLYVYDFGDNWHHELLLEKILPGAAGKPVCLAGERHCPPEDVGGVRGYEQFLEVIFDPSHKEHQDLVRWAGGWFQPEEFNLAAVNRALVRL